MPSFQEFFMATDEKTITYEGKTLALMDTLPAVDGSRFRVTRESTDSEWRQGIGLDVQGSIVIDGKDWGRKVTLWEDTAPKEVVITLELKEEGLDVRNVWDHGNGVIQAWHHGAAIYVEEIEGGRRYHCNDGHPDDDLNDIVFSIRRM